MTAACEKQLEIIDDNDYVEVATIRGLSPTSGQVELYHGIDVEAFITDAENSNTPIGTLTFACIEIGDTGQYGLAFDGDDITTSLAAKADGDILYRVIRSTQQNFRVVDPVTYRKTRSSSG